MQSERARLSGYSGVWFCHEVRGTLALLLQNGHEMWAATEWLTLVPTPTTVAEVA